VLFQGSPTPKVLFVSDFQRVHCKAEGRVFSEWLGAPLFNAIKRAGILEADYSMCCDVSLEELKAWLAEHPEVTTLVPLGDAMLTMLTGLESITKWQCSVMQATAELSGRKCLPMFHPDHVSRVYADHFFLTVACQKLRKEMAFPDIRIPERKFLLNPPLKQTLEYLYGRVARSPVVAIDWEFGRGQLNCLGFAVSATEAIAIKCLPADYSPRDFHKLFAAIRTIAEGRVAKICQHAVVELTWLARYGIELQNVTHDTMWAMKFLHPELDKGLDNVGRLYTPYPYWKDDNDDWTNIRNWQQHLEYNCKDTTGTFAAYEHQSKALRDRGLDQLFGWVMQFQPVIQEMCTTGLKVDAGAVERAREALVREHDNFQRIIESESLAALGKVINPRSPKQLQELLKALGMKLPTKRVKGKAHEQITTDKKALVKLKRKYPDSSILPALVGTSAVNKRLSSYIDFDYDREAGVVHFTLDGCSTENGRWASYKSSWGTGFNAQTVPKPVRSCFVAAPGCVLVQIDLKQADSRVVAWEAPEPKLMELLTSGADIHKYVASQIFKKPQELVNEFERQLGKKAGHAANYGTGPRTFAEACLVEMNHYLEEKEARYVLEGYFQTFPGIRKRQANIKQEVYNKRVLKTPFGRERHFYGRMDDSTFREAYAYSPPSTVADITNHLMLSLWRDRDYLGLAWDDGGRFLLQVHDSLLLQARPERVSELADYCRSLDWHPKIELPGGTLKIPVDVEFGPNWRNMAKV
jgi:DNA polymerase I-like protein with 3'-5' exonuclease and polymerase domains